MAGNISVVVLRNAIIRGPVTRIDLADFWDQQGSSSLRDEVGPPVIKWIARAPSASEPVLPSRPRQKAGSPALAWLCSRT